MKVVAIPEVVEYIENLIPPDFDGHCLFALQPTLD
jgi:hypothetical protein